METVEGATTWHFWACAIQANRRVCILCLLTGTPVLACLLPLVTFLLGQEGWKRGCLLFSNPVYPKAGCPVCIAVIPLCDSRQGQAAEEPRQTSLHLKNALPCLLPPPTTTYHPHPSTLALIPPPTTTHLPPPPPPPTCLPNPYSPSLYTFLPTCLPTSYTLFWTYCLLPTGTVPLILPLPTTYCLALPFWHFGLFIMTMWHSSIPHIKSSPDKLMCMEHFENMHLGLGPLPVEHVLAFLVEEEGLQGGGGRDWRNHAMLHGQGQSNGSSPLLQHFAAFLSAV